MSKLITLSTLLFPWWIVGNIYYIGKSCIIGEQLKFYNLFDCMEDVANFL